MAGNLFISKINGGQIGHRNILINGLVNTQYEINQRNKTFTSVSDGEYFADRWKRVDASNMTQIVEDGNYNPSSIYCLSGTGVTTQILSSPSSGNWTIPNISATASYIQLEEGSGESVFEWRSKGYELILCKRYFGVGNYYNLFTTTASTTAMYNSVYFQVEKRTVPTMIVSQSLNLSGSAAGTAFSNNPLLSANSRFSFLVQNTTGGSIGCIWTADAEL